MALHTLVRETLLPLPRPAVFAFFADARNLEAITPASLRFRILTPLPIEMRAGALIDYRLSLRGLPMRWRTRIDEWVPDRRFVDVQLSGPYRRWRHTHEFEDAPGGTRMRDTVEYQLPLGPLGDLAHALFVRREVEGIFDHRNRVIGPLLGLAGHG
jgi:ligand-binding SRPBCC domain-containing protein